MKQNTAIIKNILVFCITYVFFVALPQVYALSPSDLLMTDAFDALSGWSVTVNGHADTQNNVSIVHDSTDTQGRGNLLTVNYPGQAHILIRKTVPQNISSLPNVVYEIEFYDDPQRDYGADFYVADANGRYYMFGVSNGKINGNYFIQSGEDQNTTVIDSKISRTLGWHKLQLFVTQVGTYLAIKNTSAGPSDTSSGQSLVYLRGKLYPQEISTSFPIFSNLTHATEVAIEYPTWSHPASTSYWDNFRVYRFRPQDKSTTAKIEDLLIQYLNTYETDINSSQFTSYRQTANLKNNGNFQLSRLGFAAAYGIRAKRTNSAGDWQKMETILNEVLDDYTNGWSASSYDSPIAAQAAGLLASWQWNRISQTTKNKILTILPQITDWVAGQAVSGGVFDPARPNGGGDSKAEENAWSASLLGFMADFLPQHPNHTDWETKAKILACNSTSSSVTNGTYPCEVSQVLTPNNLRSGTPNFLLINHNQIHAGYALTIPWGLSQAALFKLNRQETIPIELTKNISQLYTNAIAPYIRFSNFTYRGFQPEYNVEDRIALFSGRDDWGQDATLQDNGWAYLDKLLQTSHLQSSVNFAWLTRAEGSVYPQGIDNLSAWLEFDYPVSCFDGGQSNVCVISRDNAALHFFLNSMDAIDKMQALFIVDPTDYQLTSYIPTPSSTPSQTPTPTPVPLAGDLNGDHVINIQDIMTFITRLNAEQTTTIFTYTKVVADYGKSY